MTEVSRCDGCKEDIDADTIFYCINFYVWDNDFQRIDIIGGGDADDKDFCSLACVAAWCERQPPPERKKRRRR